MLVRLLLVNLLLLGGLAAAQVRVVASIAPYGDLVRQLAGDLAQVEVMLPVGASPHTYEPTPRQAATLANAHLVVMNGGVDEWFHELVESAAADARLVEALDVLEGMLPDLAANGVGADAVAQENGDAGTDEGEVESAAGSGIDAESADAEGADGEGADGEGAVGEGAVGEAHPSDEDEEAVGDEHAHEGENPHVWLDPILMAVVVERLAAELIELDPANEESYRGRASTLLAELAALDSELRETLRPVAGAPFIPFHDAWPYFASRYGLDLVLEIEPFPGREPSPRYLAEVVSTIAAVNAPAIFAEAGLSDRPARVLAEEAGVALLHLDPLGAPGVTYQELLRRNAITIRDGLLNWNDGE